MNPFSLRFGFLLWSLLCLFEVGFAKSIIPPQGYIPPTEKDIIRIESISIDSLNVDFLPTEKHREVFGRVTGFSAEIPVEDIRFIIENAYGGTLWEYEFDPLVPVVRWETVREKALRFTFDLKGVELSQGARLVVRSQSARGDLLGEGEELLPLGGLEAQVALRDMNVKIKNAASGFVSFKIENPFQKEAALRTSLSLLGANGELVQSFEEKLVTAKASRVTTSVIPFVPPLDPGVYTLALNLLDDDGAVGGALKEKIVIKGDFARITVFDMAPVSESSSVAEFFYHFVAQDGEPVDVSLVTRRFSQGGFVGENRQEQVIRLEGDVFTGVFELPIEKDVDVIEADLFINRGGNKLAEDFDTFAIERVASFVDGDAIKPAAPENEVTRWAKSKWLLWGALPLLIFLVAISNWAGVWGRKFVWILLLSSVGIGSVAQASTIAPQAWWLHPVSSWYFNATPDTGFESFSKIRFQASMLSGLTLDTSSLFIPNTLTPNDSDGRPDLAIARFTNGSTTGDLFIDVSAGVCADTPPPSPFDWGDCVDIDGFVIRDASEFLFDLDFATDQLLDLSAGAPGTVVNARDFLSDGDWEFEILFCMGDAPGVSCSSGQFYGTTSKTIRIDMTDPLLSIEYDADPLKQLIKPQINTEDSTLKSQLTAQGAAKASRHAKIQARADKNHQRGKKVNERAHKNLIISDLEDRVSILDFQINQINEHLAEPLFVDDGTPTLADQKTAFLAEKTAAQNGIASKDGEVAALTSAIDTLDSEITVLTGEISALDVTLGDLQGGAANAIPILQGAIRTQKRKSNKDFVAVTVECSEASGSDCRSEDYPVRVRGNFCDPEDDGSDVDSAEKVCDHIGVNGVAICDQVGNCSDSTLTKIEIDWYDPVVPEVLSATAPVNQSAAAGFQLSVSSSDLRRNNVSTEIDNAGGEFNSHACGYTTDSALYNAGSECRDRYQICSISPTKRGIKNVASGAGAACASRCDDGFIYDDSTDDGIDNGLCLPECDQRNLDMCLPAILDRGDCTDNPASWSPDPVTVGAGIPFMQENNCGKRRQSLGTSGTACSNPNTFGCALFNTGIYQP